MMSEVDPETLLEWLQMGSGDERDMQLIALEQLCMLLLMSDNVDRCFESCPPRTFLPALCRIFLDQQAPDQVLEVTARAITYYLDVSAECTRRIVAVDGAVKAMCNRLVIADIVGSRASKDLAEQCIKVLELVCTREAGSVFESGGLAGVLTFIRDNGALIHKDTLHSAMSVVCRLCTKMEPTDESLPNSVECLSTLLRHEDFHVAEGALKCFASLADRFIRKNIDPVPLNEHGLTDELLNRLRNAHITSNGAGPTAPLTPAMAGLNVSGAGSGSNLVDAAHAGGPAASSSSISTTISLLSILSRGSEAITHSLLRSALPDAIEHALQGDERCVLDTMRLTDLLLVLLFEGRPALSKSVPSVSGGSGSTSSSRISSGLRPMDSTGERTHRHLIDCIRSKDTDALIEAVDSGNVEVNFMDDVGQTLLNWASAFGTQEMVEYLCQKNADVNKGQRSSSLHYAACFGRPQIARVLLRHGANPDLRDEDGKTPLDKARERNDEGHREVAAILQSPADWLSLAGCPETTEESNQANRTKEDEDRDETASEEEDPGPKGDPEMIPVYVKALIPMFCQSSQSTMIQTVKRASLSLIKKIIHYLNQELIQDAHNSNPRFVGDIVEVLTSVLDNEEDEEGHLTCLLIIQDLMSKEDQEGVFLEQFAKLGLFQKVHDLAVDDMDDDISSASSSASGDIMIASSPTESTPTPAIATPKEDAKEIIMGKGYTWRDWSLARGRDCLYIWSDAAALELSNGSNGWFRFILDGKLATMYSSGSPEGNSDSSDNRGEFLDKLQRARAAVKSNVS
ncbi:hypothetical protein TCAL_07314 [Tigriopus californicus]|uniref:E3 ubiquitin-protein ligase n=2 Tax=Tigriopus californicus TaxID=6832 RepID=A0A553PF50_TIGCA|nr:hypothetical protein TCAL_07314 [Tigriopus californicus]